MNSSISTEAPAAPNRLPSSMSSIALSASPSVLQTMTPFAGGEAGGFDDDGRAEATGGGLGAGDAGVDLGAGGGNPLVEEELLGERLGGLDLRGGLGRSEDRQTGGAEAIDDACLERCLGADDGEIDGAFAGEPLEGVDVEHVDRDALPELGDARGCPARRSARGRALHGSASTRAHARDRRRR